jgi:hypothetical protein
MEDILKTRGLEYREMAGSAKDAVLRLLAQERRDS